VSVLPGIVIFGTDDQVWEHSPIAQASNLDRKKKREAAAAKKRALPLFCPRGMTACGIEGVEGAFEVSSARCVGWRSNTVLIISAWTL
jgi:hypothetical protein